MQVPEFQTAYREARPVAFSQSIARLQQGATAAATMVALWRFSLPDGLHGESLANTAKLVKLEFRSP
jgi:hypothetical protein